MPIAEFPPLSEADDDGLLAFGGDPEVPSLLLAYRNGIFPWPLNERTLAWFSPPFRAVLPFKNLHVARSLEREKKKSTLAFTHNQNFREVILNCAKAKNRKHQKGTWITSGMINAYCELHKAGYAHSIEAWEGDALVGGVYGVKIGRFFAAESMFYLKPNASKLALLALIEYLKSEGFSWIDCQVINSFTESLGAEEITRSAFVKLLSKALRVPNS